MNFGFIKNRYTRGASYFVDLHRNLFGTNGWNWGTALKSHRLFYVNLQTSWTLDHCKPRLCAGLRYPSAPGLPFGLRLAYCSGNWRARAICKKRVTASIPNATLTNNFLLNETATFNSRFVLVALFSLSTILLLLVVLLSLCVARCLIARALVSRLHQRTAAAVPFRGSAHDANVRADATSASYGPVVSLKTFDADNAREE